MCSVLQFHTNKILPQNILLQVTSAAAAADAGTGDLLATDGVAADGDEAGTQRAVGGRQVPPGRSR